MARLSDNSRRVPVVTSGGAVHVNYTVGDIRSITVNGTERCAPDASGNINILVPERIDVTDEVEAGNNAAVTSGGVAAAISVEASARQRLAADLAELRDFAEDTSRQTDALLDWKADVNDDLADLHAQKLDKSAIVTLSDAQYDALTEAQKNDGTIYLIYEDDTD